jgi:hypothetical protein
MHYRTEDLALEADDLLTASQQPGTVQEKKQVRERVCCLLVLDSVTSTLQWIRQPEAAWGVCVVFVCLVLACKYVL